MLIMLKLCNFGTIYLWIFVWKVLQVCTGYSLDDGGGAAVMIKPYPYQMFDYTDDLLHGRRRSSSSLGPTATKHKQHPFYGRLHFALQPKTGSAVEEDDGGGGEEKEGRSVTSSEITFENDLNDFDIYKIANAIWPPPKYPDQGHKIRQQQSPPRHRFPLTPLVKAPANFLCAKDIDGGKRQHTKDKVTKTSLWEELSKGVEDDADADDMRHDDDDGDDDGDEEHAKLPAFPLQDHDTSTSTTNGQTVISNSNNGNGNENSNYSDNKEAVRNNYSNDSTRKDREVENALAASSAAKKRAGRLRDKKPKQELNTPYLPAISGGSIVNLGKFFRDLSRNVQFSEKHEWGSEEQKLLEGDPIFGNLEHHLTEPHVTTDRAGEWIKAIRYYRPSQKIRSLVAMNPHGQWAHGSNFIDPNYMWMGLGK